MPEGPDRLPPIPDAELSEAQRAAVEEVVSGPRGELAGNWVPFLRSPELLSRLQRLGEFLRFGRSLDDDLFELVVLCVAQHWGNDFEWGFHHPLALRAGLPEDAVDAVAHGRRPDGARVEVLAVWDLVQRLLHDGAVDDAVYERAVGLLGETAVVEVAGSAGYYTTLAMTMNLARTPAPPGARLPAR